MNSHDEKLRGKKRQEKGGGRETDNSMKWVKSVVSCQHPP